MQWLAQSASESDQGHAKASKHPHFSRFAQMHPVCEMEMRFEDTPQTHTQNAHVCCERLVHVSTTTMTRATTTTTTATQVELAIVSLRRQKDMLEKKKKEHASALDCSGFRDAISRTRQCHNNATCG
jgi:hypothetical protein